MSGLPRPDDRAIVVTGATGFLGRRLVRALVNSGVTVSIIARPTSDAESLLDLEPRLIVHRTGTAPLSAVFAGGNIGAVIHLATAYGRRGESASDILEANVGFPLRLLEATAEHSSAAFFNADSFFTTTTTLPEGLGYYALSKSQFRDYGVRVAEARNVHFVNVRIEHMYGPGDDEAKFLPSVLRRLLVNEPSIALTRGEQRRDFIFVDDVVSAFITLLTHRHDLPHPIATVGIGSGLSVTIRRVVEMSRHAAGSQTTLEFGALPYRAGEIMDSRADIELLHGLGWKPAVALAEGLERTINVLRTAPMA